LVAKKCPPGPENVSVMGPSIPKVVLWGTSVKRTRGDQFQQPKVVWGDQICQLKVAWADHFWLPKVVPRPIFGRTTFGTTHPSSMVWWRGAGQNLTKETNSLREENTNKQKTSRLLP